MATEDSDWQSAKKTVLERSCYMFNNPFMSDVHLKPKDSAKFYFAHKYVLSTSSDVFHTMFYGPLAKAKPDCNDCIEVVHIDDTDEQSLEQFLRFLYSDKCDLTGDNVVSVINLSKKYMVPSLTEKCAKFLEICLDRKNVLIILKQAMLFDMSELQKKCWQFVDSHTAEVATTEAFNDLSQPMLTCILKQDHLNIPEIQLFQEVIKWCDEQCSKNQLEVSGKNRRAVLKDAVYDIAYLSMSSKDFAKHVQPSGLLSADEMLSIYGCLNGLESSGPSGVKWKKRNQVFKKTPIKFK